MSKSKFSDPNCETVAQRVGDCNQRGYPREVNQKIPRNKLENGEDDDTDDQFYEEYFDHDLGRDEDEDE
ncbi:hypothetical protein F2Q68_00032020 [Brassica cretica]|uniref:Uncharacterized protein n=1 Tax=Brassica cretica TaxID=69181 RepID=A0A8S9G6W0_BRACR|nr:hypothetical protein F2Q68_00032020 [Brassica cretica]